jgi:hypothetical protein
VDESDAVSLFRIYADEEVAFYALPSAATRESIELALINRAAWSDRPHFAVVRDGELIGEVVLEVDACEGTANLGYAIAHRHWGHGLGTEAALRWSITAFTSFVAASAATVSSTASCERNGRRLVTKRLRVSRVPHDDEIASVRLRPTNAW